VRFFRRLFPLAFPSRRTKLSRGSVLKDCLTPVGCGFCRRVSSKFETCGCMKSHNSTIVLEINGLDSAELASLGVSFQRWLTKPKYSHCTLYYFSMFSLSLSCRPSALLPPGQVTGPGCCSSSCSVSPVEPCGMNILTLVGIGTGWI
jgi:hypothetical protein